MTLEWRETAPGLLCDAEGQGDRRFIIAFDGEQWTLDLVVNSEFASEQQVDPQPAATLAEAKRMAQE
jgi:hypothetical protein